MKCFLNRLALALAVTLLALCCAGCFSTPESRQAKQGKERMEAYLQTRDVKKYSVDTAATDRTRTAPDRIEMTEFVRGKYRIDGREYEYRVNVKTGEIYTSERMAELREICFDLMCAELGVDPARCAGLCNAYFPSAPGDDVLPAEIDDPAAYARSHLHSDELVVFLWLVCPDDEVPTGGWTAEATADWNDDVAHVCVIPAGEALPEFGNGIYLGYRYFEDFTGDKYVLSAAAAEFTPHL